MAKARVSTHPVKKRTRASKAIIARLHEICLALPETTEVLAWGEPTWRVRGKIFAQLDDHHHGSGHVAVWLPAPDGAQAALIDADPERFFRPPYVGHKGWIAVILDGDPDWGMVASLVEQAHGIIAGSRAPRARRARARR
ncbi:MAG: MmcQ/YjbR family DNA-binding protein [Acidobacteriota bacterium]